MTVENAKEISCYLNKKAKEKYALLNVNVALKASRLRSFSVTKLSSLMYLNLIVLIV